MWKQVCVLMLAVPAMAQVQQSSITGIITDPTGAAVPAASVVVTNRDTATAHRIQSNDAGIFLAPSLIPGNYSLQVEVTGFHKKQVDRVTLDTGQTLRIDVKLEIGSTSETVEVTASATALKQESAEVSAT